MELATIIESVLIILAFTAVIVMKIRLNRANVQLKKLKTFVDSLEKYEEQLKNEKEEKKYDENER